jgi:peptidylprolyl isomerase
MCAPPFSERLEDPAAGVRRDAAFALGRQGGAAAAQDPEVEDALLQVVEDGDARVRRAAIEALGFRGGRRAAEFLLGHGAPDAEGSGGATGGEEAEARTRALVRLALRVGPDVADAIVRDLGGALLSGDPGVRGAAALFFAEAPDPQRWSGEAEGVAEALERGEEEDGTLLLLAQALANQRNPGVRDRLLRHLAEASREALRLGAARGLNSMAYIETPGVREALFRAVLEDPSDAVALAAAEGLYRGLRVPAWVQEEALALLLREDVPHVRQAAFLQLLASRISHEPIMAWTRARLADDPSVAEQGIQVLGTLPDPPVTPFLFEAAEHPDPFIQEAAARALAGRWERILGPDDELLRYRAIFGRLAREGTRGAASVAIRSLAHPVFAHLEPEELLEEALRARRGSPAGAALSREFELALREMGAVAVDAEAEAAVAETSEDPASAQPAGAAAGGSGAFGEPSLRPDLLEPLGPDPLLVLELEAGSVAVVLLPEEAPRAVGLLVERTGMGLLDGVPFHRVIPGVLAQGGDVVAHDGTGREGFAIPLELTSRAFRAGTLGVAGPGDPGRGLQFFLTGTASSALDREHGAVGSLASGPDVLLRLREGARILRACVVPHPGAGSAVPRCPAA